MKDFSFFYGPIRTWATLGATIALLAVVGYRYLPSAEQVCITTSAAAANGSSTAPGPVDGDECTDKLAFCDEADDPIDCAEGSGGGGGLDRSSGGGPVLVEAGTSGGDGAGSEGDPSPWDRYAESGNTVPFVSLQPSEEGLTDAGKSLLPTTTTSRPPRRPAPAPRRVTAPAPTPVEAAGATSDPESPAEPGAEVPGSTAATEPTPEAGGGNDGGGGDSEDGDG